MRIYNSTKAWKKFHFFNFVEIWSQSLTNQLPQSWLAQFQLSGQSDAKGQRQVIWRSHGQFDPRELSSAISLAKSLVRVEYELAKCQPGPLLCTVWRHNYHAWVLLIHYSVWLQVRAKHCKCKIISLEVTACGLLNYIPQSCKSEGLVYTVIQ